MHRSKTLKFLTFGVPAVLAFGLGIWQTKRYFWKTDLLEQRKKTLEMPVTDKIDYENISSLLYRKIEVTGTFDHEKEALVGLRKVQTAHKQGMGSFGEAGYYVVTPFHTTDGHTILVNRGWISRHDVSKADRKFSGQVTIEGITREPEKSGIVSNSATKGVFLALIPSDIEAMTGVKSDVLMDQTSELDLEGQPILQEVEERYLTFQVMPPTHAVYALTWFTMCAWALGTAYYLRKKKKL
jgi:surfeit locus 1 family protein